MSSTSLGPQGAESRAVFHWVARVLDIDPPGPDDFKTGVLLIRLLERLFGEQINPKTYKAAPQRIVDMVINNDCALQFLRAKGVKVINLSGRDIVDGNIKSLLSTLIQLYFKSQQIIPEGTVSARVDPLLLWVQSVLKPKAIDVTNWVSSWIDGRAIYGLVAITLPSGLNLEEISALTPARRESVALLACERLGISIGVSPGDIISVKTGSKVVQMVVQEIYAYTKNPRPIPTPPVIGPDPVRSQPPPCPPEVVGPVPSDPPPRFDPPPFEPEPNPPSPFATSEPPPCPIEVLLADSKADPAVPSFEPPRHFAPPPFPVGEPPFDPDLPPPPSRYSLGIDLGASRLRYSLFSMDNPSSAFDSHVIDARASVDPSGRIFVSPDGAPPPPEFTPLPSLQRLFGRKFADPAVASAVASYPLHVIEDPDTHNCAVDIGAGIPVTPERVTTALLTAVRDAAARTVGESPIDTAIGVPALFTTTQRAAVEGAARTAGLSVSHIASGPLLAARAMKATGGLEPLGEAVIVDVGASKTEVSVVQNMEDAVREVRTVGADDLGSDDVRDSVVRLCLPLLPRGGDDPLLRVRLCRAVEDALDPESGARRIVLPDIEFAKEITDEELAAVCAPVSVRLRRLIDEAVPANEKSEVKALRCVGGGTLLPPLQAAVKQEFPEADFAQANPDQTVVCGATLDGAQETNRLPKSMRTDLIAVAPYSIGTSLIGGVISVLVQRRESLPAVAEVTYSTVSDNQKEVNLDIYQGEHLLTRFAELIGGSSFDGLPPMRRGQCHVACRVEYDRSGILRFSAKETTTEKSISATFTTKTTFSDDDRMRLEHASGVSQAEELRLSNVAWLRGNIQLEVGYAAKKEDEPELVQSAKKWQEWLAAHEDGDVRMFEETLHAVKSEFFRINPELWEDPGALAPDVQFKTIWPLEPLFTDDGAAIIRFSTAPVIREIAFQVTNDATNEESHDFEIMQFESNGRLETVARVCFPADGKYTVKPFGAAAGETRLKEIKERLHSPTRWRIEVKGAPAAKRPLALLITDRPLPPLECNVLLEVTPGESLVRLPDCTYKLTCKFRGKKLGINGREMPGEPEQVALPEMEVESIDSDWSLARCELQFPSEGFWRVIFWVDDEQSAVQKVVAGPGGSLTLTDTEKNALTAPIPTS
jgi:molecular chaperone DnaK (HSP70)